MKMFLDESGNDGSSRAFLLGGFAFSNEALGPFDEEWRNILATEPAIQYFKHGEAKGRSGQFEAWMPEAIERKLFTLADVIAKHAQFGMVSIFPHALYQYVTSGSIVPVRTMQRVMNGFDPYSLCAHDVMSSIIRMAIESGETGLIDFTFDAGQISLEDCVRIYETIKPMLPFEYRERMGEVRSEDDRTVTGLQAADPLVGQILVNSRTGKPDAPFQRLIGAGLTIAMHKIEYEHLTGFLRMLQQLNVVWATKILETSGGAEKGHHANKRAEQQRRCE
jgi:hypothetical protein